MEKTIKILGGFVMFIPEQKIYPRTGDTQTVYLKSVITNPNIKVGDYTVNHDKLVIGKYCSIACGAKFMFTSANHTLKSLSTYPFPLFWEEYGFDKKDVTKAWDNKGDIIIGNDVWIGYEAVIMSGVHIGNGAIIGTRAVVTKDVEPYAIVGGVPAKPIKKRFKDEIIEKLQAICWWDWDKEKIREKIKDIMLGTIDKL